MFTKHEKGQGLVDYALILLLISVVSILALQILGPAVGNVFSDVNYALSRVIQYKEDVEAGEEIEEEVPPECYGTLLLPIMVFTTGTLAVLSSRHPIEPKNGLLPA